MYKDVFHLVLCVLCESLHFTHTSKHLHDCIISPRGQFWGHKTSLIQQLIVEVRVCTKAGKSEVMCLYVRGTKPGKSEVMCLYVRGTKPGKSEVMCLYVRGTKPGKLEVMCLYVRGNDFASFYNYCILEMF